MTRHVPDALMILGGLAVPAAIALVHWPIAVAVFGLECVLLGVVLARTMGRR